MLTSQHPGEGRITSVVALFNLRALFDEHLSASESANTYRSVVEPKSEKYVGLNGVNIFHTLRGEHSKNL